MHLRINIDMPSACEALFIAQGQSSLSPFLFFSISLVLFSLPRRRFFLRSQCTRASTAMDFFRFVVVVSFSSSFSRCSVYRHFETEAFTESESTEAIEEKALPPRYRSTDRHSWNTSETHWWIWFLRRDQGKLRLISGYSSVLMDNSRLFATC